jgi:hypothetical protein
MIIDEMGYIPCGHMEAQVFFQLISKRYERGMSLIFTSNKSCGEWGSAFGDSMIAAAILDRLLHRSATVNIRGESYRLREKARVSPLTTRDHAKRPLSLFASSYLRFFSDRPQDRRLNTMRRVVPEAT